jgi:hypothetical protein
VPVLLARWRTREIWTARQFRACGGATLADVEELYDDTIAVLVERGDPYESEEEVIAGSGATAKLAAGVVGAVLLTGGALTPPSPQCAITLTLSRTTQPS